MSKERARRRAEREAEAATLAEGRAKQAAAAARRQGRRDVMTSLVQTRRRRPGVAGVLAAKRRRKIGLLAVGFFFVQLVCWVSTPDWGIRVAVLVVSVFALPVVTVLAS
ncbi:MAG: hypothetical protein WKF72_11850 [Nocardioidaceae bacterium]|jgi:Flp pilus assembly protein TadB